MKNSSTIMRNSLKRTAVFIAAERTYFPARVQGSFIFLLSPFLTWPRGLRYGWPMNRLSARIVLILLALLLFPYRAPAPLIYRPGEGWSYEMPGAKGDWHKQRAKDQLAVSQQAFDKKQYRLALKSSLRVIRIWPLSDYAPQAQYLIGRCYEARKMDEKAFTAYQTMLDKYPKTVSSEEVQRRQFAIAVRFLHGQWLKLFGYIPFFPSMDKTAEMFDKIVRYGPYGELGPPSQMDIGAAREKEKDYPSAVRAYERAADRYSDQRKIAAEAQYKEAAAYNKQAKKADYDQSIAGQAIATFTDFMALYPDDPRVAGARQIITTLKAEEARGNFNIAEYYEKQKKWDGALIYYNEVLLADIGSPLANLARRRIDTLKKRPPSHPSSQKTQVSPGPWTTPASPAPWTEPPAPATPALPAVPTTPDQ
jgi:outer membrane protein assembly factor BamD